MKADVPGDGGWGPRSASRSADPKLFFPASGVGPPVAQIAEAKTVCARCEVRGECLALALATRQRHRIRGGTRPEERAVLRNKARAARLADAAMVS